MKRIKELEKELRTKLDELAEGITYGTYLSSTSGNEILRGQHIQVYVPQGVDFNPKQVAALFNLYYDDVTISMVRDHNVNGKDVTEMVLDLDSDERNELIREGEVIFANC